MTGEGTTVVEDSAVGDCVSSVAVVKISVVVGAAAKLGR